MTNTNESVMEDENSTISIKGEKDVYRTIANKHEQT